MYGKLGWITQQMKQATQLLGRRANEEHVRVGHMFYQGERLMTANIRLLILSSRPKPQLMGIMK